MRIGTLLLASILVFLLVVASADAKEKKLIIMATGHLEQVKDADGNVTMTICECPDVTPPTCVCAIFLSSPRGAVRETSYDDLATLDSFDGEDEEFLYFKVATREDTEPPVFDLSVRGDALVKISKQHLKEYLLSEE